MIKKIFSLLVMAVSMQVSMACINDYSKYPVELPLLENGQLDLAALLLKGKDGLEPYWQHGFSAENNLSKRKTELTAQLQSKPGDFRILSDLAGLELKIGSRAKGLEMLEKLYAQYPQEYNIAANLGTAYELNGNNAKAYELIQKAMAIHPQSHYGSEWIHLRILEFKLGKIKDPKALIGLQNGDDFKTWVGDKAYRFPRPADTLLLQIAFQLHERTAFIPAPDSIIAQLAFDFADITAKHNSLGTAIDFYLFAEKYNPQLQARTQARIQYIKSANRVISIIWMIPLAIILTAMFIGLFRRKKA